MTPDEALAYAIRVMLSRQHTDSECPVHPSCVERLEAIETLRSLRAVIAAALA